MVQGAHGWGTLNLTFGYVERYPKITDKVTNTNVKAIGKLSMNAKHAKHYSHKPAEMFQTDYNSLAVISVSLSRPHIIPTFWLAVLKWTLKRFQSVQM